MAELVVKRLTEDLGTKRKFDDLSDQLIESCLDYLGWEDFISAASVCRTWHQIVIKIHDQLNPEWKQGVVSLNFEERISRKSLKISEVEMLRSKVQTQGKPKLCLVVLGVLSRFVTSKRMTELSQALVRERLVDASCPILIIQAATPFDPLDPIVVATTGNEVQSCYATEPGDVHAAVCVASFPEARGRLTAFHFCNDELMDATPEALENGAMVFAQNSTLLDGFMRSMNSNSGPQIPMTGGIAKCALYMKGTTITSAEVIGFGLSGNFKLHSLVLKGFLPVGQPCFIEEVERAIDGHGGEMMSILRSVRRCEQGRPSHTACSSVAYLEGIESLDISESEVYFSCAPSLEELQNGEGISVHPAYVFGASDVVIQTSTSQGQFGQFYSRCNQQCLKDVTSSLTKLHQMVENGVLVGIGSICCGRSEQLDADDTDSPYRALATAEATQVLEHLHSSYIGYMCNGELGPPEFLNASAPSLGAGEALQSEIHGFTNCMGIVHF